MNYNASQALCFTWQLDGRYLEMDLRVSSRGKLYFLQAREMAAAKGRSRARHGPWGSTLHPDFRPFSESASSAGAGLTAAIAKALWWHVCNSHRQT